MITNTYHFINQLCIELYATNSCKDIKFVPNKLLIPLIQPYILKMI